MAKVSLQKKIKRILKSPKLLLITAILVVLSTSLLLSNKGLWRHLTLRHEISVRQDEMTKLEEDEAGVMKHIALLRAEDQNTIERIARERYNLKKPGELIYREN